MSYKVTTFLESNKAVRPRGNYVAQSPRSLSRMERKERWLVPMVAEAKRKKIQGQGKQNQVSVTAVSNSANNSLVLHCQGSLQPKGSCPLVLLISVAAAHSAHQVGS